MLFGPKVLIETDRLVLRLPKNGDYSQWREVRENGVSFLAQWEPLRQNNYLSRRTFRERVHWSAKATADGRSLPLFLLPKNAASRGLLEKCGFKYEGVAQAYLQIAGRWRTHVLYANIRWDRRGPSDAS